MRPGGGFEPNYRLAGKTECNGATQEPLFGFLKSTCPPTQLAIGATSEFYFTPIRTYDITWNFEKFLIGADGKPVKRYNPATSPFNVVPDIEEQLQILRERREAEKAKKAEEEEAEAEKDVRKARVLQGLAKKHRDNKTKP